MTATMGLLRPTVSLFDLPQAEAGTHEGIRSMGDRTILAPPAPDSPGEPRAASGIAGPPATAGTAAPAAGVAPGAPAPAAAPTPAVAPGARRTDYYDPAWGELVKSRGVTEDQETWFRQLPYMRVYGLVVLAVALVVAYPTDDPGGWRGPVAVALMAALTVDFFVMWIRRPIWHYPARVLAVHGLGLFALYAALICVAPGFAVLQLLVYPQIVFSLRLRWSVIGGLSIGVVTALVTLARAAGDLQVALPGVVASLLGSVLVIALAAWIREIISQSMERRALIDQLEATRAELAAAERSAGVAEERARMAREIHDTLAQGFASVVTHLEAADASLDGDAERARRHVRAAEEVARASLGDARTLVWALRPEAIAAGGLAAAIERVAAAAASDAGGQPVEVAVSGEPRRLHPEVEVTLLRAAQEALANARRHAAASRITVTLTYFQDEVSLDVADDGRGFDPVAAALAGGLGLLGMRERAEGLGGTLSIESSPGEGSAIAVTLPAIAPPGPGEDTATRQADGAAVPQPAGTPSGEAVR